MSSFSTATRRGDASRTSRRRFAARATAPGRLARREGPRRRLRDGGIERGAHPGRRARRAATFVLGTEVTGFTLTDDGSRLAASSTSRGTVATESAVIATGPFTARVAAFAGVRSRFARRGARSSSCPQLAAIPADAPMTIEEETAAHWRPAMAGCLGLFTDPDEPAGEAADPVPISHAWAFGLLDPASDHALARVHAVLAGGVERRRAGVPLVRPGRPVRGHPGPPALPRAGAQPRAGGPPRQRRLLGARHHGRGGWQPPRGRPPHRGGGSRPPTRSASTARWTTASTTSSERAYTRDDGRPEPQPPDHPRRRRRRAGPAGDRARPPRRYGKRLPDRGAPAAARRRSRRRGS